MADGVGDIDMGPLEELIAIRREQAQIREFQERAEAKRGDVDAVVVQRVLEDYARRHAGLEVRAAPLKVRGRQEYQKVRSRRERVQASHDEARLAKQELEFRRTVGELTDGDLADKIAEPERVLDTSSAELAALDALKARFVEGFGSEAELEQPPQPPQPSRVSRDADASVAGVSRVSAVSGVHDIAGRASAVAPEPSAGPSAPAQAASAVSAMSAAPAASAMAPAPVAPAPVAPAPIAPAPVAPAPVAPAPVASAPLASAPVASAPLAPAAVASPVAPVPVAASVAAASVASASVADAAAEAPVDMGFYSTSEPAATEMGFMPAPVAVLVGPYNGDASGAVATPHPLGESTYIGRAEDVQIRVQRPSVSRQHAIVCSGPTGFTIRDLRSQNGTYINGERITAEQPLQDGDRVTFGDAEFVFQFAK